MMLESMVVPVPSEFVMPFAGFLVAQGTFSFLRLVEKYGKYVLVDAEDIRKTEEWFQKRGDLTVFLARLIPVVRHLISFIAGIGKMNVKKFTLYTILGATLWNGILTYLGFILGQHWNEVSQYLEELDIIIVILLIVGCLYFAYRHITRKKKKQAN